MPTTDLKALIERVKKLERTHSTWQSVYNPDTIVWRVHMLASDRDALVAAIEEEQKETDVLKEQLAKVNAAYDEDGFAVCRAQMDLIRERDKLRKAVERLQELLSSTEALSERRRLRITELEKYEPKEPHNTDGVYDGDLEWFFPGQ
jgi:uncharacterized protein YdiU (UPF0061 family)